jgi:UDP-N-acetylmuramate dehydrogenase
VRFHLPSAVEAVLGYLEHERKVARDRHRRAERAQVADWVIAIRRAKLPDPAQIGNAGSFFKNPSRHARAVPRHHRPRSRRRALPDARRQREARRRLDDRRLRLEGQDGRPAGVYEKQALVLVNRGGAIGPR